MNKNKEKYISFSRGTKNITTNILYSPWYIGQKKVCVKLYFPKKIPDKDKKNLVPMIEMKLEKMLSKRNKISLVSTIRTTGKIEFYFYGLVFGNIEKTLKKVFGMYQDFSYGFFVERDLFFLYKNKVLFPSKDELHEFVNIQRIKYYNNKKRHSGKKIYFVIVFHDYFLMKEAIADFKKHKILLKKQGEQKGIVNKKIECTFEVQKKITQENIEEIEKIIIGNEKKYKFEYLEWKV